MRARCKQKSHQSVQACLGGAPRQGVFLPELQALYSALRAGRAPELPPLEVTYADYSAWQRARLDSGQLAKSIAYWKVRLQPCLVRLMNPCLCSGITHGVQCYNSCNCLTRCNQHTMRSCSGASETENMQKQLPCALIGT